jgi:uncharacterized membrane protein YkoI
MKSMRGKLLALATVAAVAVSLFAVAAPARADGDHDRARRAREAGEIAGLETLLAAVARDQPGKLIDVELERKGGRYVYEIKLIAPDGNRRKFYYDARTLERLAR